MTRRILFTLLALGVVFGRGADAVDAADGLELRDGDRIVLLGNTLIERAQIYGYLETMLTIGNPGMGLTFRNIGWSADNAVSYTHLTLPTKA